MEKAARLFQPSQMVVSKPKNLPVTRNTALDPSEFGGVSSSLRMLAVFR